MGDIELSARAAKLARHVEQIAASHLGDAGEVRIAVRVNLQGLVGATAGWAIGGAVGMAAGSKLTSSAEDVADAGFPTDAQQAIGLTDDAVVVVSRSPLSGKPKAFRASIPLGAVAGAHLEKGGMGDKLRLELSSGARVDFTCVKTDPGAEFAAALNQAVGGPPGT